MINNSSKMTVYLIQHSHTDIGYTTNQTEIADSHADYIRDVINYNKKSSSKCKWVCEGLWGVEQFLNTATPEEIQDFINNVRDKNIGISGNFLNMTEMIADEVMEDVLVSAYEKLNQLGIAPRCAMTADVNGYSASFPNLMNKFGVKYLLSLINDTHGGVPFKRQTPFIWKGTASSKLVCWIGEHYNQGNFNGLDIPAGKTVGEALAVAREKLPAYITSLKEKDYPYDFCPITISGVFSDNAPPSFDIADLVALWNEKHGGEIEIKYCLLEEFFKKVKTIEHTLPIVSGDWTDWWADGVSSTPNAVRVFRQAQRNYLLTKKLDPQNKVISFEQQQKAARALTLFAEHTWGYYASVSDPWDFSVARLELQKCSYAALSDSLTQQNLSLALGQYGRVTTTCLSGDKFCAINPFDDSLEDAVAFEIPFKFVYNPPKMLKSEKGLHPVQFSHGKLWSTINLKPGEILNFERCDNVSDIFILDFENEEIITSFYKIKLDRKAGGIVSIWDIKAEKELICGNSAAFLPVYEITKGENGDMVKLRSEMQQSRSCESTERFYGKLVDVSVVEQGAVFLQLKLTYSLEGSSLAEVEFKFYNDVPIIDLRFILNKDSCWEPENVYLSLPFSNTDRTAWIDKGGAIIRPQIDGLPNACASFYSLQNGVVWSEDEFGVGVVMLDNPLIRMGDLENTKPLLCSDKKATSQGSVWAWVLNNFWETNFKATIGGFHEFRFRLTSGKVFCDEKKAFSRLSQLGLSVPTITLGEEI